MDREMEARHLLLADRNLAVGRSQIAAQETRLARLREQGRNTAAAERLLALFQDTLAGWKCIDR